MREPWWANCFRSRTWWALTGFSIGGIFYDFGWEMAEAFLHVAEGLVSTPWILATLVYPFFSGQSD